MKFYYLRKLLKTFNTCCEHSITVETKSPITNEDNERVEVYKLSERINRDRAILIQFFNTKTKSSRIVTDVEP